MVAEPPVHPAALAVVMVCAIDVVVGTPVPGVTVLVVTAVEGNVVKDLEVVVPDDPPHDASRAIAVTSMAAVDLRGDLQE